MTKLFGNPTPKQMEFSGLGTPTVRKPDRAFESAYKKQEANLARKSLGGLSRNQAMGAGIGFLANRGGGADAGAYGQQDIDAQIGIAEDIWKKTTPDLNYIGGSNKWTQNPDGTWALTSELDEMEQGLYDQSGMLTSTLGDQAQDFFGGGYEGMYQNRLDRLRNQYTAGDAREEEIRRARQIATGASSTGIFQEDANRASFIDQRDLGLINQADLDVARHGDFLMGNRERSLGMLTKTGNIGNQFLANQMTYADPTTNYQNLSDAYTGKFDQLAAADTAKRKGKSKFWDAIFQVGGAALGVPPTVSSAASSVLFG